MKQIILFAFVFTLYASCSGNRQKVFETKQESDSSKTVALDWSESTFLKPYIDSLKNLKEGVDVPQFLKEDCFDFAHKFYWRSKHNPTSFRKQLIFSINNPDTLLLLLKNSDRISDEICTEKLEHPYGGRTSAMESQQLTTLQLVKFRFKELER